MNSVANQANGTGTPRVRALRRLSQVLVFVGLLAVSAAMLYTYLHRRAALNEAAESAKDPQCPKNVGLAIGKPGDSPEYMVFYYDYDSLFVMDRQFTHLFDDGSVVRIRGKQVEAFLSRGYRRDLWNGVPRLACICGSIIFAAGMILAAALGGLTTQFATRTMNRENGNAQSCSRAGAPGALFTPRLMGR